MPDYTQLFVCWILDEVSMHRSQVAMVSSNDVSQLIQQSISSIYQKICHYVCSYKHTYVLTVPVIATVTTKCQNTFCFLN